MNKYKTYEELKEELGENYDKFMYEMNLELVKQKDEAIEYITGVKHFELDCNKPFRKVSKYEEAYIKREKDLLNILKGSDKNDKD